MRSSIYSQRQATPPATPVKPAQQQVAPVASIAASAPADWRIPASLNVPGFLRQARVDFIRMQAAWDQGDIEDIRAFTTPGMFAKIRHDARRRDGRDRVSHTAYARQITTTDNR